MESCSPDRYSNSTEVKTCCVEKSPETCYMTRNTTASNVSVESKKVSFEINAVRAHNAKRVQETPNTCARSSTRHSVQSGTDTNEGVTLFPKDKAVSTS